MEMFDSMGLPTPPTKLQPFFFGIRIARVWSDPQHDIDVISGHLHPLDQRPDEGAFARPVRLGYPVRALGSTLFQTTTHPPPCCVHGGLIRQLLPLFLEAGDPLAGAG